MTLKNFSKRGRGQGQVTPVNFWALNANCSNMAKDTDFKFDKHVAWNSPNMSPKNLSKMGVAMVMCPLKFWALDSNLRGYLTLATPPFRKFFKGHVWTVPGNMPAKFEVRSFECVGSRQRLSVTTQNRWTQVHGPEHSRRQSLI